jgi:hypothetical protein
VRRSWVTAHTRAGTPPPPSPLQTAGRMYYEAVYIASVTIANFPISLLATLTFGTIVYFTTGAW